MKKISIAFVCPWPEEKTGIADGCFAYVNALKKYCNCDISVYTTNDAPTIVPGVAFHSFGEACTTRLNEQHDAIVVHIGNNDFHREYLHILQNNQCIVHLHDLVLHHLLAGATLGCGKEDEYFNTLRRWHSREVANIVKELLQREIGFWDTPGVIHCPMFEPWIHHADSVIVSSLFSQNAVRRRFPRKRIERINMISQLESDIETVTAGERVLDDGRYFDVGMFGIVAPNKHPEVAVDACKSLCREHPDLRLHIVGHITPPCEALRDEVEHSDLRERILFYGRVSKMFYLEMIAKMRFTLALRYPTMGETSGVVNDSMLMGVPVVVNTGGTYGETPNFVKKLSAENCTQELRDYLSHLLRNRDAYAVLLGKFQEYARSMAMSGFANTYYRAILSCMPEPDCSCPSEA